jgi:hypothetical protein
MNATSVEEANRLFMLKYEKPANTSEENIARRAALGQKFYDQYAGQTPESEEAPDYHEETKQEVKNYYMIPSEDLQQILNAAKFIEEKLTAYQ